MEKIVMDDSKINDLFKLSASLIKFPAKRLWIDYDKEADVLYISFRRPQRATDSEMLDNGILLRYNKDMLVGITVMDASTRSLN